MRVFGISRGYQVTEIDTADAAGQFLAWLAADTNRALTELIQHWLWQPADSGGLGALAESAWDVAVLRAEIIATWQRDQASGEATR